MCSDSKHTSVQVEEDWYCYICGKSIGDDFFIWSMSDRTDRVFLSCSTECNEQMDESDLFLVNVVRRITKKEEKPCH